MSDILPLTSAPCPRRLLSGESPRRLLSGDICVYPRPMSFDFNLSVYLWKSVANFLFCLLSIVNCLLSFHSVSPILASFPSAYLLKSVAKCLLCFSSELRTFHSELIKQASCPPICLAGTCVFVLQNNHTLL